MGRFVLIAALFVTVLPGVAQAAGTWSAPLPVAPEFARPVRDPHAAPHRRADGHGQPGADAEPDPPHVDDARPALCEGRQGRGRRGRRGRRVHGVGARELQWEADADGREAARRHTKASLVGGARRTVTVKLDVAGHKLLLKKKLKVQLKVRTAQRTVATRNVTLR
jgi:hypothetical protein